jgi:hypothetical protein
LGLGGSRWLHDAALNATRNVPIVTLFQDDPVAAGLIASLARSGGNLTGVGQTTGPEFFRKRLQLLMELAPYISLVAFVGPRGVLEQDRGECLLELLGHIDLRGYDDHSARARDVVRSRRASSNWW